MSDDATPTPAPGPSGESRAGEPADGQISSVEQKLIEGQVIEAIRTCYDPEIPVNIYELGLIYDVLVDADSRVGVRMTLTAPACPVAGMMPGLVESAVRKVGGVTAVTVELVWDPPWHKGLMSDAAKLQLGML